MARGTLNYAAYSTMGEQDMWPGYLALMPVEGAFLIIIANRHHSFFDHPIFTTIRYMVVFHLFMALAVSRNWVLSIYPIF